MRHAGLLTRKQHGKAPIAATRNHNPRDPSTRPPLNRRFHHRQPNHHRDAAGRIETEHAAERIGSRKSRPATRPGTGTVNGTPSDVGGGASVSCRDLSIGTGATCPCGDLRRNSFLGAHPERILALTAQDAQVTGVSKAGMRRVNPRMRPRILTRDALRMRFGCVRVTPAVDAAGHGYAMAGWLVGIDVGQGM